MPRVRITDPADDRVADYTRLTDVSLRKRREPERGMYIAESNSVVRRAVEAGHRPRSFLMNERSAEALDDVLSGFPDVPVYWGDDDVLESLTGFHLHRGALAAMQRPALPDVAAVLAGARRVAILEDIVDHTNVGALIRSAAAMGVDAVLVTPRCADPLYRRAIRVSMGTVFQVPWTRIDPWPVSIGTLQDAGFVVAGMTLGEGAITLDELVVEDHEKLALVFGSEGHGLTRATEQRLDRRVTIPMMDGVDSLNVAAASAVTFYATR
ncbi:TrmH family RNA methyltransferase [Spelaeicoccus albus]|uniref:tRNA G18 (Ribose-2'-O)-methylase SpoU n=1 Tax=Spelaeicoccus albus TaxID=1280376 RepID=A0A7Z0D440_9MICO|nr:RNA methyltransferase [Spelaeicoccus albus]NYI68499.1 tRNA G18 (ribose-2'-O)-methylase SpoU [Spelaeicoccus albus]